MPFYEYECPHCSYHDEVLQKITDKVRNDDSIKKVTVS